MQGGKRSTTARSRYLSRVRTEQIQLEGLPGPLVDLDIDRDSRWVAVCGEPQRPTHVVCDGVALPLSISCQYPIVRLLDDGRAVLIGSRSRGREKNGWVLGRDGSIERSFRAGDAVEDLVVCGDRLVVTYFDEALVSPDGLFGVAVLDFAGARISLRRAPTPPTSLIVAERVAPQLTAPRPPRLERPARPGAKADARRRARATRYLGALRQQPCTQVCPAGHCEASPSPHRATPGSHKVPLPAQKTAHASPESPPLF